MRTLILLATVLTLLTPIQAQDTIRFQHEVSSNVEFNITGGSFEDIFSRASILKRTLKRVKNTTSIKFFMTGDFTDVVDALNSIDGVQGEHLDGIQIDYVMRNTFTARSVFRDNDAVMFEISGYSQSGTNSFINLDSLFGYKLLDLNGADWFMMLLTIPQVYGYRVPSSIEGLAWAEELMKAGYLRKHAETLAALAEEEGIDFNGLSGRLLLDLLTNQMSDIGASYQNGANPMKHNTSKVFNETVSWQELGLAYTIPVHEWLSVSLGARWIRGVRGLNTHRAVKYGLEESMKDMFDGIGRSFYPTGDVQHTLGIDAAIHFTPEVPYFEGMHLSLVGRNLNTPTLQWKNKTVRFQPKITAGLEWNLFSNNLPLKLTTLLDLTRRESLVLPGYHTQHFSVVLKLEPEYNETGVYASIGIRKNVAESYDPWTFQGSFGLQLWTTRINVGGFWSTTQGSIGSIFPRSAGLQFSVSTHLEW